MKYLLRHLAMVLLASPAALPAADQPNLILILADDLGYGDIGPFGSTKNRTPNLDRMAQEGMKLTSFYAAPVCTPSRAQVLTGCYAKRVSLPDVIFPAAHVGLNPAERTVAEVLKTTGYATMCIGKWHVGDQAEFLPTRHGFDHYFGLPYSNDMGGNADPPKKGQNPPLPLLRDDQVIEIVPPSAQDRLTERYTDEAVKFITEHQATPFFLYLPHTAVHVPLHPGEQFRGHSANGTYGDWVEEVDASVGRVLTTLRELNLAANTLVIFTSDNGPWLTQGKNGGTAGPLRGGKGGTYEGGMREPTVAWWPGKVPPGSTCDAVTGNIDLLPTFAALGTATLPVGVKIDGKDLTPLLLGQTQVSPREAQFYFSGNRLEAVRSGPWKLAIARQAENMGGGQQKKPGGPATAFTPTLYNLDTDIGETNDVTAQHPEVVARLQQLIAAMDADLGTNKKGPGVRPPGRAAEPVPLLLARPDAAAAATPASPTELTREQRIQWWREARFGMFIHWGLYAIPGGVWKDKVHPTGYSEWIMFDEKIPAREYAQLATQFNPVKFDARAWTAIATKAGMKYLVLTTKHHDGFSMFKSALTPYNVVDATPFKRDVTRELSEACRASGLRFGCYYSIDRDWYRPQGPGNHYRQNNGWDYPASTPEDFNSYFATFAKPQVEELLTQYQPDLLWFDEIDMKTDAQVEALYQSIRSLRPAVVINSRIQGCRFPAKIPPPHCDYISTGDNEIADKNLGFEWENPGSMNTSYGFNRNDHNWVSAKEVVFRLVDIVSKGGNYLLNVGPTAEGLIPQPCVDRLLEVGAWMAINGEAIYGTSPWRVFHDGAPAEPAAATSTPPAIRFTAKGNSVYAICLGWPEQAVMVRALGNTALPDKTIAAVSILGSTSAVQWQQTAAALTLPVPQVQASPYTCVYRIDFKPD